jgi:hypothetical protein
MTINVTVNATGADGYVYEGMKNSPQPLMTKVPRGENEISLFIKIRFWL